MSAKTRRKQREAREKKLTLKIKAYPPNENIFRDYIEKQKLAALSSEWVFWMLSVLHYTNERKIRITDEFMKKDLPMHLRGEPIMDPPETDSGVAEKMDAVKLKLLALPSPNGEPTNGAPKGD